VPHTRSDGPGFVRRPPSEHADALRPLDRWAPERVRSDSARRLPTV